MAIFFFALKCLNGYFVKHQPKTSSFVKSSFNEAEKFLCLILNDQPLNFMQSNTINSFSFLQEFCLLAWLDFFSCSFFSGVWFIWTFDIWILAAAFSSCFFWVFESNECIVPGPIWFHFLAPSFQAFDLYEDLSFDF